MYRVCAFTGHRNLNKCGFDAALLDRVVRNLIITGTEEFLCGMAVGFDLAAAEAVIYHKRKHAVKLTACIPCANQTELFSEKIKARYKNILGCCDEVITLAPAYYEGCMLERNKFMVDRCDALVSFLRRNGGGTYYTVNYARKAGKRIIEL